jgi:Na+-driven multidrug efflux pump
VFAFVVPITVIGNMLYQSIRKAEIASFLAMLRSGVVLVPIILIFYYAGFGFRGIALATPISDVISAIITLPFLLYFLLKKPKNEIINEEKKKI